MLRYYSSLNHFKIFYSDLFTWNIQYINHLFSVLCIEFHPIKFISSSIFILPWIYHIKHPISLFIFYYFVSELKTIFVYTNIIDWKRDKEKNNMGVTLKLKINIATLSFCNFEWPRPSRRWRLNTHKAAQ